MQLNEISLLVHGTSEKCKDIAFVSYWFVRHWYITFYVNVPDIRTTRIYFAVLSFKVDSYNLCSWRRFKQRSRCFIYVSWSYLLNIHLHCIWVELIWFTMLIYLLLNVLNVKACIWNFYITWNKNTRSSAVYHSPLSTRKQQEINLFIFAFLADASNLNTHWTWNRAIFVFSNVDRRRNSICELSLLAERKMEGGGGKSATLWFLHMSLRANANGHARRFFLPFDSVQTWSYLTLSWTLRFRPEPRCLRIRRARAVETVGRLSFCLIWNASYIIGWNCISRETFQNVSKVNYNGIYVHGLTL